MANKKVSDLTAATTADGSELYYVVQSGADRKMSGSVFTRRRLTADTTFYVSTTGNDTTGVGSSGNPWATVNFALEWVANYIDFGLYNVTVELAAGSPGTPTVYSDEVVIPQFVGSGGGASGGGFCYLQSSDGVVTNTIIRSNGPIYSGCSGIITIIGGLTLDSTGGRVIQVENNATVFLGTSTQNSLKLKGLVTGFGGLPMVQGLDHASIESVGLDLTLEPSSGSGWLALMDDSSSLKLFVNSLTITGSPTWSVAFLGGSDGAKISTNVNTSSNVTGSSSGKRFSLSGGAFLSCPDRTLLPGNAEGDCFNGIVSDGASGNFAVWAPPLTTVANLPTAASFAQARRMVSDATTTTFGAIVAGTGGNTVPVYSDGTNWRIG